LFPHLIAGSSIRQKYTRRKRQADDDENFIRGKKKRKNDFGANGVEVKTNKKKKRKNRTL